MNYVNYSSISQSPFHMLFSKQIKLLLIYIKFHLKIILNLIKKNFIYSIRVILFYIIKIVYRLRFITRFIPYQIKINIRARIILYPKLTLILKKINNWININNVKNKSLFLTDFFYRFIKIILIQFLYFFLKRKTFREIIIDKLSENYNVIKKFENITEKKIFSTTQVFNSLDLSPEALEIYKDFLLSLNTIYLKNLK